MYTGTYHLREPDGERIHLSSVKDAGAIDLAQLQAASIAAIQEQQRRFEEQQKIIVEQQRVIAEMQADIRRLKATIQ